MTRSALSSLTPMFRDSISSYAPSGRNSDDFPGTHCRSCAHLSLTVFMGPMNTLRGLNCWLECVAPRSHNDILRFEFISATSGLSAHKFLTNEEKIAWDSGETRIA